MMMELSIDRAVDVAGFQAGVRGAKVHRGGHGGTELVSQLMIVRRWISRRAHEVSFLPSVLVVIILFLVKRKGQSDNNSNVRDALRNLSCPPVIPSSSVREMRR